MALKLEDKKAIVAEIKDIAANALSVIIADYRGLTVSEITELRKQARNRGVFVKIMRNTLARRAFEGTEFECTKPALTGPTILAFSQDEPGAAAKLIRDFVKQNEKLTVKALSIGGQLLNADQLSTVASLPSREEALAILMSVMQAPIAKLVRTLNEVPTKVVRAVAAIGDQKQQAA